MYNYVHLFECLIATAGQPDWLMTRNLTSWILNPCIEQRISGFRASTTVVYMHSQNISYIYTHTQIKWRKAMIMNLTHDLICRGLVCQWGPDLRLYASGLVHAIQHTVRSGLSRWLSKMVAPIEQGDILWQHSFSCYLLYLRYDISIFLHKLK